MEDQESDNELKNLYLQKEKYIKEKHILECNRYDIQNKIKLIEQSLKANQLLIKYYESPYIFSNYEYLMRKDLVEGFRYNLAPRQYYDYGEYLMRNFEQSIVLIEAYNKYGDFFKFSLRKRNDGLALCIWSNLLKDIYFRDFCIIIKNEPYHMKNKYKRDIEQLLDYLLDIAKKEIPLYENLI